ncbi:uncharacterized protein LOC135092192 isoform X1 [Scylla paramamosain]
MALRRTINSKALVMSDSLYMGIKMNNDENDPFLGEFPDDPAGVEMNFPWPDFDQDLVGTLHVQSFSEDPPQDSIPLHLHYNNETNDKKVVEENDLIMRNTFDLNIPVEQVFKSEPIPDLERAIEFFTRSPEELGFRIEDSTRPRNKPYVMEDNILFIKPSKEVKVKVLGAQRGQIVKLSLRYKTKTFYQQPVLACSEHKKKDGENPLATFYVLSKRIPITYMLENEHPTALITLTEEEGFCFYPVFRCWNFCGKKFGKSQEMILTLCNARDEVLKETTYDVRVCENVARDLRQYRKERDEKHLKRTSTKRSCREMENEGQASENLQEMGPPPSKARYFMVKMEDPKLVPALKEIAKVGGDIVELDSATEPEKCFQCSNTC